jgi:hypothetical protein
MASVLAFSGLPFPPMWRHWIELSWARNEGLGLLLLMGGFAFAFAGRSLYKAFTTVVSAFLGWWLAAHMVEGPTLAGELQTAVPIVAGVLLGAAGFTLAKYAVSLLGGLSAACICWHLLGAAGMPAKPVLVLGAACFVLVAVVSIIRHDEVLAFASAAAGALMIVFGVAALAGSFPNLGNDLHQMMQRYPFLVWAGFMTPMVIGLIFQLTALRDKGKEAVH